MFTRYLKAGKYTFIITGLTLLVFIPALFFLNIYLTDNINQLKNDLTERIEIYAGRSIQYESISPSIFQYLEIKNLAISDNKDSVLFKADILRINFNLIRYLIFNENPIKNIYIENSHINVNTEYDRDIIQLFKNLADFNNDSYSARKANPLNRLQITGKNLSLNLSSDTAGMNLSRLFLDLHIDEETIYFDLKTKLKIDQTPDFIPVSFLESNIRLEGTADRLMGSHDYFFEISSFKTDKFSLKRQFFNIQIIDRKLRVVKVKDRLPIDVELLYNPDQDIISFSARFDNYIPSRYFSFDNPGIVEPFMKTSYTGNLNIRYDFKGFQEKLNYNGTIKTSLHSDILSVYNSLDMVFAGTEKRIRFEKLDLNTDLGNLYYTGTLELESYIPDGELFIKDLVIDKNKNINLYALFDKQDINSAKAAVSFSYGDFNIENINIKAKKTGNRYDFDIMTLLPDYGSIKIGGSFDYRIKPVLQLSASFLKFNPGYIYNFISPQHRQKGVFPYFSSSFLADGDINFFTDFSSYTFTSSGMMLYEADNTENKVTASFTVTENSIRISRGTIDWNSYSGSISLNALKEETGRYSISSIFILSGQIYNIRGNYYPGNGLIVQGNYDTYFALIFDNDSFIFNLFTDKLPVPLLSMTPELSLNVHGSLQAEGSITAYFRNSRISNISVPGYKAGNIDISFNSMIENNSIIINSFSFKDNISTLKGSGGLLFQDTYNISGWLYASGDAENEKYLVQIAIEDQLLNISADFSRIPFGRVSDADLEGSITGFAAYSKIEETPELLLNITLEEGKQQNNPVSFNTEILFSPEAVTLNQINLTHNLNRISNASGYINWNTGNYLFSSGISLQRSLDVRRINGSVLISGTLFEDIKGLDDLLSPDTDIFSIIEKGSLNVTDLDKNILGLNSLAINYFRKADYLAFSGGPENSLTGSYFDNGNFSVSILDPFPITGIFSGRISRGIINASFTDIYLNMAVFGQILNLDMFKTVGGGIRGSLSISGSAADPDFHGTLSAVNIRARSVIMPEEIGPFNTVLVFQGKNMTIPRTNITVNKATASASAEFLFDQWLPADFLVNIQTSPDNRIWIKSTFAAVDVDGYAAGEITIEGNPQKIGVTGRLSANRCIIALTEKKNDLPRGKPKPGHPDFFVELQIYSGSGVEFYWPSTRFPIVRSFAATGQQLNIFFDSETGIFALQGDIGIQGGEVYYFSQSFFIKSGMISFNENQDKFDPSLSITAEMRERTLDNREVKIILAVDNNPLSRFSPRFESIPPLSQNEIFVLLGENIYGQFGGERITLGSALLGAGAYSTQLAGIMRPFENTVKRALRLDLFSIRTEFFQRASYTDERLSDDDTVIPETTFYDDYGSTTSVFLGKYFGQYFFLEGLLRFSTMDFDTYQYNYYDVPDLMGLYLKTELSLEVDTPLFLLDITFYPDISDFFKSLYGTSLQFSWRFSF